MELETLAEATALRIDHKMGQFASIEKFYGPVISGIPLGLVQQRIFWPSRDLDTRTPLCKSNDGVTGYPGKNFPLVTTPDDIPLSCNNCTFRRSYKSNTFGGNACSNSWIIILMHDGDIYNITFTGAALREVGKWVERFAGAKIPLFTNRVAFTLTPVKRNDKRYAELQVETEALTDEAFWLSDYLPLYKKWRDILETPPHSPAAKSAGGFTSLAMN